MNNTLNLIVYPLLASCLVSFFSTPLVIKFAEKLGLVDDPKRNKEAKVIHTYPVPRGGGLATFLGIFIAALIFLPFDQHLAGILAGATILVVVGLIDDKLNLNPYLRLLLQIVAALMPIAAGIGISFITNPFNGIMDLSQPQISFELFGETRSIWILSDTFALLWMVAMMNILNMGAKGIDGQLPGVVTIAALAIMILSSKFSADITQWPVIILAAITAGSYLGFTPWNFYPQKIMPGFSGSTLAGYILAILSILSTTKVGTLLVVLGIPLFDTEYSIVRRVIAGRSPFWGDRGHLHHRLLDSGMSKRQVTLTYWLITALLAVFALNLNAENKLYTIVGVGILVGGLLLLLARRPKS